MQVLPHIGVIAAGSIFLAIYTALATAYILYSIDWTPWNRLKSLVGNRYLFIIICFCVVLVIIGLLLRVFLLRMLAGLAGYALVATSTLIFLELSHWQWPVWLRLRQALGGAFFWVVGLFSLALGLIIMYTIIYLLLNTRF